MVVGGSRWCSYLRDIEHRTNEQHIRSRIWKSTILRVCIPAGGQKYKNSGENPSRTPS